MPNSSPLMGICRPVPDDVLARPTVITRRAKSSQSVSLPLGHG